MASAKPTARGGNPRQVEWECSEELRLAVKIYPRKLYEVAALIGKDRSLLSAQLHGMARVRPDDVRLQKLARLVGVPLGRAFARRIRTKSITVRRQAARLATAKQLRRRQARRAVEEPDAQLDERLGETVSGGESEGTSATRGR
jgi:transcriptional regulator with XRE-family HTH domain